jgi:chromate transporter
LIVNDSESRMHRDQTPPSLAEYGLLVVRIGLTSFGGGVSGWMMRLVVHERGWVAEAEFLSGLALCQVFPGINVLNLAIWLGYRLHGGAGALVGALAMIVPPGLVLLGIAAAFAGLSDFSEVRTALNGVAAAAVGLTGAMGARAARRSATGVVPVLVGVATFIAIGLLHWPLVPVAAVLAVLSIGLAMKGGAAGDAR